MARKERKPSNDTVAPRLSAMSAEAIAAGTAIGGLTLGAAQLRAEEVGPEVNAEAAAPIDHKAPNVAGVAPDDTGPAAEAPKGDAAPPQQAEAATVMPTPEAPAPTDASAAPANAASAVASPAVSEAAANPLTNAYATSAAPDDFEGRVDAILDSALSATTGPLSTLASDIGGTLNTLTDDITETVTASLDAALGGLGDLSASITGSVEALLDAPLGRDAIDLTAVMETPGDLIFSADSTLTSALSAELLSGSALTDIPETLLGAETDALVPDLLSSLFYSDGQAGETMANTPVSTAGEDFDAGLIDSSVSRILDDGPALMGLSYLDGNDGAPDAGQQHGGVFGI